MFEQKYNRIVLPLFFLFDLLIVEIIFIIIFMYTTDFSLLNLIILSIIWIIPSLSFKSFHVQRVKNLLNALKNFFYAYSVFTALYISLIAIELLPQDIITHHIRFIIMIFIILTLIQIFRFNYIASYRKKGKNIRYALLIHKNLKKYEISEIESGAIELGYKLLKSDIDISKNISELISYVKSKRVDYIFLYKSENFSADQITNICDNFGIRLKILLPFSSQIGKRAGFDTIGAYPIMDIRHEPLLYLGNRIVKRMLDFFMALLSIIFILTWLPIVVKLAQVFSYPGPLFFVQERIGRDGKIFNLYKFRTMFHTKDEESAKKGKTEKTQEIDKRISWFGRGLRRTNLDEYPQFINVLFGSMSTVGPRPHMVGEDKVLEKYVSRYRMRRFIKPGVTGWAAINGFRGGTDDLDLMSKRTEYDIWYLENWSIWLDIKIIFVTVWQMIIFKIPRAF